MRSPRDLAVELAKRAQRLGITPAHLAPYVEKQVLRPYRRHKSAIAEIMRKDAVERGRKINAAGLVAQISVLTATAGGILSTDRLIDKLGSELDGFVLGFSSEPQELTKQLGVEAVDGHGDLISPDDGRDYITGPCLR